MLIVITRKYGFVRFIPDSSRVYQTRILKIPTNRKSISSSWRIIDKCGVHLRVLHPCSYHALSVAQNAMQTCSVVVHRNIQNYRTSDKRKEKKFATANEVTTSKVDKRFIVYNNASQYNANSNNTSYTIFVECLCAIVSGHIIV